MQKQLPYATPASLVKLALEGKVVRYLANKSSQTKDGVRVLKIDEVEHVGFGKKSGKRFVTVRARDLDDGLEAKVRNLHFEGIDLIA